MKLKDMKPGIHYKVISCAKRGSLRVGDSVCIHSDGTLMDGEAHGWLQEEEWRRIRKAEVEFDIEFYQEKIRLCQKEIGKCRRVIKGNISGEKGGEPLYSGQTTCQKCGERRPFSDMIKGMCPECRTEDVDQLLVDIDRCRSF
jgi:hypothetical protein